jgi:asparagine synthase (glutamine-hydrolysing)
MCGIAGYISSKKIKDKNVIKAMTDIISHRGPDGEGHYLYENIAFGHRRLSIVDLSDAGSQPMHYLDRYTIIYNGEVYNYVELKEELSKNGYHFKNQTDTEVIIAAYDLWGVECLNKFNGMWAFVLLDKQNEELFISRDRFGIKPLYIFQDNENFIFSSEIKSILKHPSVKIKPNMQYLSNYLKNGPREYISETAFENITRFPFSSYSKFKINQSFTKFKTKEFWRIKPNLSVEKFCPIKAEQYAQQYYDLLSDAVRLRLRTDVKVGSALSGGLDSSSIVYLVNQQLREMGKEDLQETFSSVYKSDSTQDCDESDYIDLLAEKLNVNSNQIEPKEIDIPTELEKMIWYMENPPESTCMSAWHTFKKVREKKVVATLDGQGADEQLAGYLSYIHVHLTSLTLLDFYKEFRHFLKIPGAKKQICIAFLLNHFKLIFGERLLKKFVKKVKGIDLEFNLNKKLAKDLNTSLINLIHYSDHISMGHSIESRMPFMDYRLVEFLASVPATYKMHNGWPKYLARLAFDKKLPNEICWRKDKLGWPEPENFWLKGGLKNWFIQRVTSSSILSELSAKKNIESDINSTKNITILIRYLNISIFNQLFFGDKNESN